jgi:DNA-binding CsgD family transcriptional regulator
MIAAGKSTKEIAAELYIHPRTVETHRASICSKLQLSGANSLLRFALEHKSELMAM